MLALVPYAQTLSFGFTLDDANTIVGHRGVKEALSFDDLVLRDSWGRSRFDTVGVWRPIATLSYWIDQHVGGGRTWPFHLTNVLLYVALVALADWTLARWCGDALSPVARWLAVGMFASLAIHADVVPSATGRAETLAAIFSLGAIAIVTCGRALGAREIALVAVALLLAILAKESSAPMVVLVPLLAWRAHGGVKSVRGPVAALASWGVLVGLAIALFRATRMPFVALGPDRLFDNPLIAADAPHRFVAGLGLIAFRLRHVLVGTSLVPDYSFSEQPISDEGVTGVVLGAFFVVACIGLLVVSWSRVPRIADALLAFGASYVSMSNFVVSTPGVADRHFFFPSLWLVVVVALVVDRVARAPRVRALVGTVAIGFVVVQSCLATAYASTWRDDVTLLSAAARVYPDVFRTQRNLAHALADEARDDDAAFHLVAAEAIFARYPTRVARDAISPAWDGEPLDARLTHLSASFGARATCDAARIAAARLRSWRDARAGEALDAWSRGSCGPR